MSNPYVGEIRVVGFNFAPFGWALCNGRILAISQNTALFSLLGTFYGGDGKSTFALPNLQGLAPMHQGSGVSLTPRNIGETGGETAVTLLSTQIPSHTHVAQSAVASTSSAPAPNTIFGGGGRGKEPAYAPARGRAGCNERPGGGHRGRQRAAQQHAALRHPEFYYRSSRRIPAAFVAACSRTGRTQERDSRRYGVSCQPLQ